MTRLHIAIFHFTNQVLRNSMVIIRFPTLQSPSTTIPNMTTLASHRFSLTIFSCNYCALKTLSSQKSPLSKVLNVTATGTNPRLKKHSNTENEVTVTVDHNITRFKRINSFDLKFTHSLFIKNSRMSRKNFMFQNIVTNKESSRHATKTIKYMLPKLI